MAGASSNELQALWEHCPAQLDSVLLADALGVQFFLLERASKRSRKKEGCHVFEKIKAKTTSREILLEKK